MMIELEDHGTDPAPLFDSAGIAVVWLDAQLKVRRFTPAVGDLLEILPTDIGRPLAHLARKFTDGDLLDQAARAMAEAIPIEAEVHSHSGRDYLQRTLPYQAQDRRVLGAVITFIDISARKHKESALEQALQTAQQLRASAEAANRAKDNLIATVSHDLRTPLNTIRLWSRMFASGKVAEKAVLDGARIIGRAALAQQQLIDDLLDASSLARGQLRLELSDAQLGDVITGAVAALQPLADSRRITLRGELGAQIGPVHIDPHRMQQALYNLLANALELTPAGGQVRIRLVQTGGFADIEITDTGRAADGDAGTGLRLDLARQLIALHGGTLSARADDAVHGATTSVRLSLQRPEAEAAQSCQGRA